MPDLLNLRLGELRTICHYFEVRECIGQGRFADVYKAYENRSAIDVALKIYKGTDVKTFEIAQAEYDTLGQLKDIHAPYFPAAIALVKYRDTHANAYHPALAMELGEYADEHQGRRRICLADIIPDVNCRDADGSRVISELFWERETLSRWILSLCASVTLIHKHGIIHRDLKPDNILLKRLPGENESCPFILDFNTSVRSGSEYAIVGGTAKYLPPEVRGGQRRQPAVHDDLWAVARIVWEIVFGSDAPFGPGLTPHCLISNLATSTLTDVLLKALSTDVAARYSDMNQMCTAVASALERKGSPISGFSQDELIWARDSARRVRDMIADELAGEEDLAIPKDLRNRVRDIVSCLSDEHTRSFDLRKDLLSLGPRAIPAIFQESYKVRVESVDFETIVGVLQTLHGRDTRLTDRALDIYSEYSNFNIRQVCWRLCEALAYFPTFFFRFLDESRTSHVLLPEETVNLADMCIKYSKEPDAIMVLDKYMCMEYIEDPRRYNDLKERIASRLAQMAFDEKARLVVEDCQNHIWEESDSYQQLNDSDKSKVCHGLMQLMGDSFAHMEQDALNMLKAREVPERCRHGMLRILYCFCVKTAQIYDAAFNWLRQEASKPDAASEIRQAWDKVGTIHEPPSYDQTKRVIADLLGQEGYRPERRLLVESQYTFGILRSEIAKHPEAALKILKALALFRGKKRYDVVKFALHHWELLGEADYSGLVDLVSMQPVRYELRDEVLRRLAEDLATDREEEARRGIDLLLNQDSW